MAEIDQAPTFNLKAVIKETGLKPDTLRAWERRYGLPTPERTAGRHRLYSQRDIETLKWLVARQEEGLSISRAVDLWRKLEAEGQDPLIMPEYTEPAKPALQPFVPHGETIDELREEWFSACLDFDEQRAEQTLAHAFALYPPEIVCFEILVRGLNRVGEGWYSGDITVQQEHFASALAMRRIEMLVASTPPPTRPGRILTGCASDDPHAFAPLLITFLLKRRGWDVVYLGARVPAARLESTILSVKPDLVVLSAQQLSSAASLLEITDLLKQKNIPLAFGGTIFNLVPALRERIPGHFLGEYLEEVVQRVEWLMDSPESIPPTEPVSHTYQQALAHYLERHMILEADVWQLIEPLNIPPGYLTRANEELAHNIQAALKLGDLDLLATDMEWIEGLLINHNINPDTLHHYLKAYYQAAQTHLAQRGAVIVNWLAKLVDDQSIES